ncbi:MAG: hypothetical protein K9L28_02290 [Synergistales bacterium]|nr:hypothetical protein [Synergistales bacterium]
MSKFSLKTLEEVVFPYTDQGAHDPAVLLGAAFGEDVAMTQVGGDLLLSHVDPIVGAVTGIGWLAMHVACNDIAASGVPPRWAQILVLVPGKEDTELVGRIMGEAEGAATEIGVSIVGGHTGYSSGVTRPVVAVTAMAPAEGRRVVRTGGARPGDRVVVTRGAGVEGTSILAADFADEGRRFGLTEQELAQGAALVEEISVVASAMVLAEEGATAMHDVTRGGVRETALEMATLSGVHLELQVERLPERPIIARFAEAFGFDPLGMLSSGSLVAAVPADHVDDTLQRLEALGIPAADVGKVADGAGLTLVRDGVATHHTEIRAEEDELARMWAVFR